MDLNQTRYISITLTEPEWESLRALQPDPCRWLKQQVHQLLEENGRPVETRENAAPVSGAGQSQLA
jgi:hypothetical protein